MRSFLVLTLVALLANGAAAAPTEEVITDEQLGVHVERLAKQFALVREGKLKQSEVIRAHAERAGKGATARERAINSFMFAIIQDQVLSRHEEARRGYQNAIKAYPRFPAAHVALARLAAVARDTKAAERHVRAALQIDTRYVDAIVLQAKLYAMKGNHDLAIELFKRSIDVDLSAEALVGLGASYMAKFHGSYDAKEKKELARLAEGAADAFITVQPENPGAYLYKAQVNQDLGQLDNAIEVLEVAYERGGLPDKKRIRFLFRMRALYQMTGNADGVAHTLERMLKHKELESSEREQLEKRLAEIKEKGSAAFFVWQIEAFLKVLENPGRPLGQRRQAMSALFEALTSGILETTQLREMQWKILKRLFKVLPTAPPELRADFMRALRKDMRDPLLVRILVHFIYPHGKTEEVREETVRTLGAVADEAAVPALLYCLREDSGRILREVDKQLSRICGIRSPVGGGIEPLTAEQIRACRLSWNRWVRSADGAAMLVISFSKLNAIVKRDPAHTRQLRAAPMVDHAVVILQDGDVDWTGWKAAYEFLVGYWGKDFRPVDRREKPVEEFEREAIVKELTEFVSKVGGAAQPPSAPKDPEQPEEDD